MANWKIITEGHEPLPYDGNAEYRFGATCIHKGKVWRCTHPHGIHNPAFEPGGFAPFGWEIV